MILSDETVFAAFGIAGTVITALWLMIKNYIDRLLLSYREALDECHKDRKELQDKFYDIVARLERVEGAAHMRRPRPVSRE